MLGIAMYTTIQTLWDQGSNKSQIAALTGHDWKTIDKVIGLYKAGQDKPLKKPHPSILDEHKDFIIENLEKGLSGSRIHDELLSKGVKVSYSNVRHYISKIKARTDICVRFVSKPAEEAQVDFGYAGLQFDPKGKRRKAWVFNMRLSYSRLDYYEIVFDQSVETFINCHINAFAFFGGVPRCVKIDNLKAAVLNANFYEPVFQSLYKSFAEYCGFKPLPCRVRKPQEKGKVESGIKFIKNNFLKGRDFGTYCEMKSSLDLWLKIKCNNRVHGTTRKIPAEHFEAEEKSLLLALPKNPFSIPTVSTRAVYRDCHVYIDYNYYSVPYEYVGKNVDINIANKIVKISFNGKQVAVHEMAKGRGEFKTNEHHYPRYKYIAGTDYQKLYQNKMAKIGEYAEELFLKLLKEQKNSWHQSVKGILSLKKHYADEVVNLACKRALYYGATQYRRVKNICSNGLYTLPLENRLES